MIGWARELHLLAVHREDVPGNVLTGHVLMTAELRDGGRIRGRHRAKLRMAVLAGRRDLGDGEVMDHPALVPAGFVVDDKESGNIREDIDERSTVLGICR